MIQEALKAIGELEHDCDRLFRQFPSFIARVRWLCELVKVMGDHEPLKDDRDAVLSEQADRIAALESRMGLTHDAVLAIERAELVSRDMKSSVSATLPLQDESDLDTVV